MAYFGGLSSDCLDLVFQYSDAYSLAFLYLSGDKSLQSLLLRRVTHFRLAYNPYRRVFWPSNFLRLLTHLEWVEIGDPRDHHGPMVPNVDLNVLPSTLRHLALYIGNGLVPLFERDAAESIPYCVALKFMNIKEKFPLLEELHWSNLLCSHQGIEITNLSNSFPSLRSLSMSCISEFSDISTLLPSTISELRLYSVGHTLHGKEKPSFPPGLKTLVLERLGAPLNPKSWPPHLEYLHIEWEMGLHQRNIIALPLPDTLLGFHLSCDSFVLTEEFLRELPPKLLSLKFYIQSVDNDAIHPDIAHYLPSSLLVFHLCTRYAPSTLGHGYHTIGQPPYPQFKEFVLTWGSRAGKWPVDEFLPPQLSVFRANPLPQIGWKVISTESFDPQRLLFNASSPIGLVDLEDSIDHFKHFPPTLTRLSLQSFTFNQHFDYKDIASRLPNVTDLTLRTDLAFRLLKACVNRLPISTLVIEFNHNLFVQSPENEDKCREEATNFDLRLFGGLKTLHIDLRLIQKQQRTAWLDRLPTSLTDLSLVPYEDIAVSNSPGHVYVESWVCFPRLPRSLTRFTGCISDLDCHGIFAHLPDTLIDLYLIGYCLVGTLATGVNVRPACKGCVIQLKELAFLPLSLRKVKLPDDFNDRRHDQAELGLFFASRPQLALFGSFSPAMPSYSKRPIPHALRPPVDVSRHNLLYHTHDLRLWLPPQACDENNASSASKSSKNSFSVLKPQDCAVRPPRTELSDAEIAARWKASKIANSRSLRAGQEYLQQKLLKIRSKHASAASSSNHGTATANSSKSSRSTCSPS